MEMMEIVFGIMPKLKNIRFICCINKYFLYSSFMLAAEKIIGMTILVVQKILLTKITKQCFVAITVIASVARQTQVEGDIFNIFE